MLILLMTMFNGNMVGEAYIRFNMCVCPLDNFKRLNFFFALNDLKNVNFKCNHVNQELIGTIGASR
jgi:hypothetical protein